MRKEDDVQLKAAKKGFREAEAEGNREEEARWANVIGDILKRRGEYVEALRWLRRDYEISTKHLPQKQLLPTCQSLGEVFFRLERFREALTYQKKHLQIAKDSEDLIEQQRASTQLGRTYHEIFLKSEDDHYALQNAKKYFKSAMKLARTLKEKQSYSKCSLFLKEFIDAYNNLGMLEKDLDNLEEARKILLQGLKICDEEEIPQNDDGRTRLHHNLGTVYLELRQWSKAKEHIEQDIKICKNIDHPEGEAKGFINLGELHYQMQNYEDAVRCYHKALKIASTLQDEDALINTINQNIETAKEAKEVMEELKREELKLRKLARATSEARGTGSERRRLLELYALLDGLIEKFHSISAWSKLQEFAKRKKRVADELCDKEKLSDSYLTIGESYQKLRNFNKARKWYMKSWNISRSIGNLEGQALAKINIGNVLDSAGDWAAALESYEDGYKLAVEGNIPSAQLSALENMHYSHMIRFSNIEQARKLQDNIQKLRRILVNEDELKNLENECCPETESEGEEICSRVPDSFHLTKESVDFTSPIEDSPSRSLSSDSPKESTRSNHRKRTRVVISDDEDVANVLSGAQPGESAGSLKSRSSKHSNGSEMDCCSLNGDEDFYASLPPSKDQSHVSGIIPPTSNCIEFHLPYCDEMHQQIITVKIEGDFINLHICSCMRSEKMSGKYMEAALACLYYLHLPEEKKSKGLVPIIRSLKLFEKDQGEASIEGWVPKRLMKSYIDCCKKISEECSMKLLINLYNLEVSEDEVSVSDCGLQDVSISPFLDALRDHKSLAALDLSHNLLGNRTMEKIKQIFNRSSQTYGGLTLDLHSNQFGPTSLFQICECNILLSRLEVLNISENRLTDACCSYLATILLDCKSLYSLNLEQTSITSRTVQKIADALPQDSPLSHLFIGRNAPVSATAVVSLLDKLSSLKRFSELSLRRIKLNKSGLDALCRLVRSCNISVLDLGESNIRSEGAVQLFDALTASSGELIKLDLSVCGLIPRDLETICKNNLILRNVVDLNLSGNFFRAEASGKLAKMIADPCCCIRVLRLDKCRLGFPGIVHILEAASESESLEEIYLADNIEIENFDLATASSDLAAGSAMIKNLDQTSARTDSTGSATIESLDQRPATNRSENHQGTSANSHMIEDLSAAIASAAQLQVLDLSENKFSEEVVEVLYRQWQFPPLRGSLARMHLNWRRNTVRFFLEGKDCCYLKPCCRRHVL